MANMSDWNAEAMQDCTVFPTVQGVAAYLNAEGDIVLRQEGSGGEEDSIIIIPMQYASAVEQAIAHLRTATA